MTPALKYACHTFRTFKTLHPEVLKYLVLRDFQDNGFIRWNGIGDLFAESITVINLITEMPQMVFSRKPLMLNKVNHHVLRIFSADRSNWDDVSLLDPGIVVSYLVSEGDTVKAVMEKSDRIDILFLDNPKYYLAFKGLQSKWCKGDSFANSKEGACNRCFAGAVGCWRRRQNA